MPLASSIGDVLRLRARRFCAFRFAALPQGSWVRPKGAGRVCRSPPPSRRRGLALNRGDFKKSPLSCVVAPPFPPKTLLRKLFRGPQHYWNPPPTRNAAQATAAEVTAACGGYRELEQGPSSKYSSAIYGAKNIWLMTTRALCGGNREPEQWQPSKFTRPAQGPQEIWVTATRAQG